VHLRELHTLEQLQLLTIWLDLSRSTGWWQPFENVVFLCERPAVQSVDSQGRLHCENGPALLCRDSFAVFAWHGVRVNYRVIEHPEELTVKEIQEETNIEVRRVMMERYGLPRFLLDSGARLVHEDEMGKLYRTDIPDDEPLVMVQVLNSTPEPDGSLKHYTLRVPPDITTARSAVAWTFGLTADEYAKQLVAQT
jgi:hypothetical protein